MLVVLNTSFHLLHLAVVVFCLIGWMFSGLVFWHLLLCTLVLCSWFLVGPLIGHPGYCVLTGIQEKIRKGQKREEMGNYIHYLTKKMTGKDWSPQKLDILTQVALYTVTIISVFNSFS